MKTYIFKTHLFYDKRIVREIEIYEKGKCLMTTENTKSADTLEKIFKNFNSD